MLGLSCGMQDLRCGRRDLSLRARAPECTGSVVAARGLSCPVARGILVPQPGIELASPALRDGFLTTGPSGKSGNSRLLSEQFLIETI